MPDYTGLFNPLVEFIVFFSDADPGTTDHWGYKSEDIVMLTDDSTNPRFSANQEEHA